MKAIKIFSVLLISSAVVFSGCGLKKMVKKQNQVTYSVTPNPLETHGGKMTMEIKGTYPAKYFHKKANVTIVPFIKAEDGTTVNLQPIKLKGEKATGDGQTVFFKNGGSFSVSQTTDYKPAFAVCTLAGNASATLGKKDATFEEVFFGEGTIATSERLATNPKLGYKKDAVGGAFLVFADHGYTGQQIATKTSMIYFEWNKDNLNWNVPLNKTDGNKQALKELMPFMDKYPEIIGVDIVGWASPEGELNRNQDLSSNRSKVAKDWFEKEYDKYIKEQAKATKTKAADLKKDIKFNLEDKGEDWDGFLAAMTASSIKEKDQIINVIRSQAARDQKQQQIRNMIAIYNEIDNILPELRRAIIKISCTDTKTDADIARLSSENPAELTLSELLYSASLTSDIRRKEAIYEAAIKLFPDDYRGYNDLACIKAFEGNMTEAKKLLEKAASLSPNNGIILNNEGVMAMMNKDYEDARQAFEASEKAGFSQAYNMAVLDMKKGDYAAASSKMANVKCDHNLALNQVLSKNYTGAKSTLECITEKTADNYYLLAIVAARTNNESDVSKNLKEACTMDARFKVQAAKDMEFKKFKNNDGFKSAIK
jgi:tetratricopeptide (TPR) repeat protein